MCVCVWEAEKENSSKDVVRHTDERERLQSTSSACTSIATRAIRPLLRKGSTTCPSRSRKGECGDPSNVCARAGAPPPVTACNFISCCVTSNSGTQTEVVVVMVGRHRSRAWRHQSQWSFPSSWLRATRPKHSNTNTQADRHVAVHWHDRAIENEGETHIHIHTNTHTHRPTARHL